MNITSVSAPGLAGASTGLTPTDYSGMDARVQNALAGMRNSDETSGFDASVKTGPKGEAEVARQFEAILVRQFLTESMRPLLEGQKTGQVYGYLLTDALADSITKGGGLGIRSVLEAQLRVGGPAKMTDKLSDDIL